MKMCIVSSWVEFSTKKGKINKVNILDCINAENLRGAHINHV